MSLELTGKHSDPHDGVMASEYSDDKYYRDFGGFWIDGNALTVDHVIDAECNVTCKINDTPLEEL